MFAHTSKACSGRRHWHQDHLSEAEAVSCRRVRHGQDVGLWSVSFSRNGKGQGRNGFARWRVCRPAAERVRDGRKVRGAACCMVQDILGGDAVLGEAMRVDYKRSVRSDVATCSGCASRESRIRIGKAALRCEKQRFYCTVHAAAAQKLH